MTTDLTRLTNIELLETALAALSEYEDRTYRKIPKGTLTFLGTEVERVRESFRSTVDAARKAIRATPDYVDYLKSLGPDDDTPQRDAEVRAQETNNAS